MKNCHKHSYGFQNLMWSWGSWSKISKLQQVGDFSFFFVKKFAFETHVLSVILKIIQKRYKRTVKSLQSPSGVQRRIYTTRHEAPSWGRFLIETCNSFQLRQALDLRLMNFPGTYSIKTYCQNHAGYAMYVVMLCMLCLVCWFWWLWMVYLTCWICLVKINHVRVVGLLFLIYFSFGPWPLSFDFSLTKNFNF